VRQIISNLLSNALKFTRFGRVDVRVGSHAKGLSIQVRDTGIGIPDGAQARIFQPFTQGNAAISRQYGGTGLGLALTRRLCEAMQGRLELHSREDYGSEFTAWLPLRHAAPPVERPALHGKIIAWTPASSGLSELLATWLPRWGLEYRRLDRDEGLAQHPADLLITDNPECLFSLRPRIITPILLVTAYGSFLPGEQASALKPLEQLARPLSRTALYLAISQLLGPQKERGSEALPLPQPQPSQRRARVLLVEDNAVNQLVAKGMLSKLGCEVITAAHGREALDCMEGQAMDLVLMDCNMPVMNGYEACQRIRRSGRWPNLPIIALTANALPEERDRCRDAGMDDYLAKPFHREELTELINRWLPRS
jgi:CheY-like chemotaxis protein